MQARTRFLCIFYVFHTFFAIVLTPVQGLGHRRFSPSLSSLCVRTVRPRVSLSASSPARFVLNADVAHAECISIPADCIRYSCYLPPVVFPLLLFIGCPVCAGIPALFYIFFHIYLHISKKVVPLQRICIICYTKYS